MSYIIEKAWNYRGLQCLVVASKEMGHRCGYVGVTKNHFLYRIEYNRKVDELKKVWEQVKHNRVEMNANWMALILSDGNGVSPDMIFEVHGGLTFTGTFKEYGDEYWFLGWDCAHSGDARDLDLIENEKMIDIYLESGNEGKMWRTKDVALENEKLADQILKIKFPKKFVAKKRTGKRKSVKK